MTALSAASSTRLSRNPGAKHVVPLNALSVVYAGSLVMLDAENYGRPAVALASNRGIVGVALANATGGAADGDVSVIVQEGEFLFAAVSVAQISQMQKAYALDDNTVDETQLSNQPIAGVITEIVSSTSCWVKVGMTEALL
jgi:hypothetical protein